MQKELSEMKLQNQMLLKHQMNASSLGDKETNQYIKFLEERVKDGIDENKRVLKKYSDIRHFAYQQIEVLIKMQNRKKNNNI